MDEIVTKRYVNDLVHKRIITMHGKNSLLDVGWFEWAFGNVDSGSTMMPLGRILHIGLSASNSDIQVVVSITGSGSQRDSYAIIFVFYLRPSALLTIFHLKTV